jgi:hypothetical protein
MADFVPGKEADFDSWLKFLIQYVTLKCTGSTPEWTHIPAAARTVVSDAYAAWYTAYSKTKGPHQGRYRGKGRRESGGQSGCPPIYQPVPTFSARHQ